MSYDPLLKQAAAEIETLCEKYDIGAHIALVSKEGGEFRFVLPKWGCMTEVTDEKGNIGIHLKTENIKTDVEVQKKAELTSHFVFSLKDVLAVSFSFLARISEKLQETWKVEHKPMHDFRPLKRDVQ